MSSLTGNRNAHCSAAGAELLVVVLLLLCCAVHVPAQRVPVKPGRVRPQGWQPLLHLLLSRAVCTALG
jgi:hypothetical protein